MSFIKVSPENLAPRLVAKMRRDRDTIKKASFAAAMRLKRYLVDQADKRGITYRGDFNRGWQVIRTTKGATLTNDAPHAGVVELGARPHKVSKDGIAAIALWARRKLGLSKKEALSAAFAIAKKIEVKGQKPTFIVRDSMPQARKFFAYELAVRTRGKSRGESLRGRS